MIFQELVVAILVVTCSACAAWMLMPAPARRAIALSLLKRAWPEAIATRLRRHVVAAPGCGCDGCDRSTTAKPKAGAVQPLTFHPPARRRNE